jgi:hypothetical protein
MIYYQQIKTFLITLAECKQKHDITFKSGLGILLRYSRLALAYNVTNNRGVCFGHGEKLIWGRWDFRIRENSLDI